MHDTPQVREYPSYTPEPILTIKYQRKMNTQRRRLERALRQLELVLASKAYQNTPTGAVVLGAVSLMQLTISNLPPFYPEPYTTISTHDTHDTDTLS